MEKYLIIGLGSMGKRRVRCLQALGVSGNDIYGMDIREDRCLETEKKYGIKIISKEEEIDFEEINAIIVSLPPDKHHEGVQVAFKYNKPVFIEASVILEEVKRIKENNINNIFIAPSCTFIFHPLVKQIKSIVKSQKYGKVCNFTYHSGQYLPDWHPWESVNVYYVGNRETGGAREIIPYELTWLVDVLGYPLGIKGYFRKTIDLGCQIEDSYVCSIDYGNSVGALLVDVVARNAVRNLVMNFEKAQLQWRCDKDQFEIYEVELGEWISVEVDDLIHEEGYNKNINENMYIDEIKSFIRGIEDASYYPNTLDNDIKVLELLKELENSDGGFNRS